MHCDWRLAGLHLKMMNITGIHSRHSLARISMQINLSLLMNLLAIKIQPREPWHGHQLVHRHTGMIFSFMVLSELWNSHSKSVYAHSEHLSLIRYLILPAISLNGVLYLDVCPKSWKAATFYSFIDNLLDNMNPFLEHNSVLVMDNASIHHSPELRELVENQ